MNKVSDSIRHNLEIGLLLLICTCFATACTDPGSRNGATTNPDTEPNLLSPAQSTDELGATSGGADAVSDTEAVGDEELAHESVLDGVWIASCRLIDSEDIEKGYRIWSVTVEGARFSSLIRNFPTPGCVSSSATYSESLYQGYFEFGENVLTSDGLTATAIEVHTQIPYLSTDFDIFLLSGDLLYFGDTTQELDGSSLEQRPQYLDFHWELQRSE